MMITNRQRKNIKDTIDFIKKSKTKPIYCKKCNKKIQIDDNDFSLFTKDGTIKCYRIANDEIICGECMTIPLWYIILSKIIWVLGLTFTYLFAKNNILNALNLNIFEFSFCAIVIILLGATIMHIILNYILPNEVEIAISEQQLNECEINK